MSRKRVTLFIIGAEGGESKKFSLEVRTLKWIGFAVGFLGLVFTAVLVDYVGLLSETAENKKLKAENSFLMKQYQIVEGKLSSLETALDRVKTFTTKLKLIANIETEDQALKLGMSQQPAPNQSVDEFDVPVDQRESLAELEKKDKSSTPTTQVDEGHGEMELNDRRDYQTLVIRIEKGIKEAELRSQSVLDLWEKFSEQQSLLNAIPNIRPARGWITSKFGYRISPFTGRPTLHTGLDIAASPGTPIYAPADGMVTFARFDEGYGKMVTIDHGHGYQTRYGHLANYYVQEGQRVNRYDIIAAVGNTGRSTGPHLHYEVRFNGIPKNPANFILDE